MSSCFRSRFFRSHRAVPIVLARLLVCCVTVGLSAGKCSSTAVGDEKAPASPPQTTLKAEPPEESWRVVYIGNTRAGYGRQFREAKVRDGRLVVVSEIEMGMVITRFGQTTKTRTLTRTEETSAGDLLMYQFDLQNPPAATSRTIGRVENDVLKMETEIAGKVTLRELPWDKSAKSSAYADRQLREHPMRPGEKRVVRIFDPELSSANTVTLQAADFEEVKLLTGPARKLLKVVLTHSAAPGVTIEEFVDAAGESWKTSISLLKMSTYRVPKEVALESLTGAEADLGVGTLIRVAPIKDARATRRVVYRVRIPQDDPSKLLPGGSTQELRKVSPDVADLTVRAISPAGAAPLQKKGSDIPKAVAEAYLPPTSFIQSNDERVKSHARRAVGAEADPWKACVLMERYVFENVRKKNFSTLLASAAEVAQTLSGDCTEHGVLLAAMARAQGIPARVAVGLVYVPSSSSFGYHMWTEVYVRGGWVPLDATLGRGGIAADHIKVFDSSLADDGPAPIKDFLPIIGVLGKMEIEVLRVEH